MKKLLPLLALAFSHLVPPAALAATVAIYAGSMPTTGPLGAGVNFAGHPGPLFVLQNAALQFGAPFSVSFAIRDFVSPSSTQHAMIGANIGSTGFFIFNSSTASDVSDSFQFVTEPPGGGSGCLRVNQACTRYSWISGGALHHVLGTFDGSQMSWYVDGILRDQQGPTTFAPNTTVNWTMGQGGINETIYDMRVFTRALYPYEAQQLSYLALAGLSPTSGPLATGLAGHWQLDGCTTTCPDTSGNGNDALFDTTPPTVAVTVPSAGAVLTGTVTLTATCTDNIACTTLSFVVDGSAAGAPQTTFPASISYDSTKLTDGAHLISCTASDGAGNGATCANVSVTSSNSVTAQTYQFAAAGSDSNNCVSAPCQTITKLNALTIHQDDHIQFNKGDTFTGCYSIVRAKYFSTRGRPFTVEAYGTGAAPIITPNCTASSAKIGAVNWDGVDGMVWNGVNVTGDVGGNAGRCFSFTNSDSQRHGTVVIENVTFAPGCWDGLDADFGGNIFFDASSGSSFFGGHMDHFTLQNIDCHGTSGPTSSVGTDACMTGYGFIHGVSFDLVQGLLVYNMGGKSPAIAGQTGNGVLFNGAGAWIGQTAASPTPVKWSVVHDIGANTGTCGNIYGIWTDNSDAFLLITQNEIYHIRTTAGCDAGGFDLDQSTVNVDLTGNYTHDNSGPGINLFMSQNSGAAVWSNNKIHDNISENDAVTQSNSLDFDGGNTSGTAFVYNNTLIQSGGSARVGNAPVGAFNCPGVGSFLKNNILVTTQGSSVGTLVFETVSCANLLVDYNGYWITNATGSSNYFSRYNNTPYRMDNGAWQAIVPGGDAHSILNINPTFAGTIGGNTTTPCNTVAGSAPQPCPSNYVLGGGSTYKGAGVDLTSLGMAAGADYYGVSRPSGGGSGYSIGASQ